MTELQIHSRAMDHGVSSHHFQKHLSSLKIYSYQFSKCYNSLPCRHQFYVAMILGNCTNTWSVLKENVGSFWKTQVSGVIAVGSNQVAGADSGNLRYFQSQADWKSNMIVTLTELADIASKNKSKTVAVESFARKKIAQ